MRTRKPVRAMVVNVCRPVVAHSQEQWQVTVIFPRTDHRTGYTKKIKKQAFTSYLPKIGQWIEVAFT